MGTGETGGLLSPPEAHRINIDATTARIFDRGIPFNGGAELPNYANGAHENGAVGHPRPDTDERLFVAEPCRSDRNAADP